jgi:hypothetical protein
MDFLLIPMIYGMLPHLVPLLNSFSYHWQPQNTKEQLFVKGNGICWNAVSIHSHCYTQLYSIGSQMIVINTGFSANSCDIIWNVFSFCTIIDFFIGNQRTKEQLFIKGTYLRIKCEMEN